MKSNGWCVAVVMACTFLASSAYACSACISSTLPEDEFDRRAWGSATHVFVGLVLSSRLVEEQGRVEYVVKSEEVLKGDPKAVTRIHSTRIIDDWRSELMTVGCGDLRISAGDRLLVVAGPDGIANIGGCSASRIVEGRDAADVDAIQRTLVRLRAWSRSAGTR